ncbi:GNAT family N-acetyltransferase [Streptomyces sp. NBC_01725]|uniref:GNAT family N-acetyltransferase n=1 Tax=Streptomyces sp. NBC_01725 TaxID=2975923 RepID=UPI002E29F3E9|nr:GNAT family N-acetyltransferase [Streptomyces sp. NBC_01725]
MTVELRVDPTPAGHPALGLRPWRDSDIEPLIGIYRDPLLRKWTRLHVTGAEDGARWMAVQSDGWRTGQRLSFAVLEGDRLVGNVAVKRGAVPGECAEVGYWTAVEARGRGIASRAVAALTDWAFDTLDGLTRLELLHQIDNTASCRVAEKTGYVYRRTLPARPPFPLDGHQHIREAPRPR